MTAVGLAGDLIGHDVEGIVGGSGDDTLTGSPDPDGLFGGAGADLIVGKGGEDALYGGDGNDTIFARDGSTDEISSGRAPIPRTSMRRTRSLDANSY